MGMLYHGISLTLILKNGEILECELGFANEEFALLSENPDLFRDLTQIDDFRSHFFAAFSTEYDDRPFVDLMTEPGDIDSFGDFMQALEAREPDDITHVILLTNRESYDHREYTWEKYRLNPYGVTRGRIKAPKEQGSGRCKPSVHDYIHGTIITPDDLAAPTFDKFGADFGLTLPEAKKAAWLQKYEANIDRDAQIRFEGRLFVFSGFAGHNTERDDPFVQRVLEKGGEFRSKVSGRTDYLVVQPGRAGDPKISAAIEQQNKGGKVKIVLAEAVEAALNAPAPAYQAPNPARKPAKSPAKQARTPKGTLSIDPDSAKDIILSGTRLIEYLGREKELTLPDGITEIDSFALYGNNTLQSITTPKSLSKVGKGAFSYCEKLKTVVFSEGLTKIEDSAFIGCDKLTHVFLPASLRQIAPFAFTPYQTTTFHVQPGTYAERFAEENNFECSYTTDMGTARKKTASRKKAAATGKPVKNYELDGTKLIRCNSIADEPEIPGEVTVIGTGAFDGMEALLSTELSAAVEQVEAGAFRNCPNLSRIIIPETVKHIAQGAFENCPKLCIDTMEGSFAAGYAKENGIPVKTDGLYGQRPEVMEKAEKARQAAAEEERRRKEEAERRHREAEEAERLRKIEEAAERRRQAALTEIRIHYDLLVKQIEEQNRIISENRGWFGSRARSRKAAQQQLAALQAQLAREFPNGRP